MNPSKRTSEKDSGKKLKVFLAGPIHGYEDKQDYRTKIRGILNKYNVAFYDAWEEEGHRNEFAVRNWQDERYYADSLILRQKRLAQVDKSDLIVAFVPKESFGTATELTRAVEVGKKIVIICLMNKPSPWIISITRPALFFKSIEEFATALRNSTLSLL